MPNWIQITTDTLNEASVAALVEACDTAALGSGQDPRAAGIIQGVITDIRRMVASCKTNLVDVDTTTIPASLRDLAVDLIMARLKKAIQQELTEDERKDVDRRWSQLKDIARCDTTVEQPDNAITPEVQQTAATRLVSSNTRQATRCKMDGLI